MTAGARGLHLLAQGLVYSAAIVMLWTWMEAYQRPDKSIRVTVNESGEAKPELVLWWVTVAALAWVAVQAVRDYRG